MSENPLHEAAREGNTQMVQDLITNGADVHAKDDDVGDTPLHGAAWNGHKETALVLVDNGADVHAKNEHGATPLHWAVQNGHKVTVQALLDSGADMHAEDSHGNTPLVMASSAAMRQILLAQQQLAAKGNDAEPEAKGTAHGEKGDAEDNDGDAVPEDAAKGSTAAKLEDFIPAIMEGMLEKFVSGTGVWLQPLTFPNPEKKFHYYMMVKPKGPDVLCLRHGADAIVTESLETEALRSELMATAQSNGVKVNCDHKDLKNVEDDRVRALFTAALADAEPTVNPEEANDALLAACQKTRPVLEDIKAAISAGAEVNKEHKYGKTGLHWAASTDSGAVEVLLAAGADPKLVTWTGQNALHIAHMYGAMSNVKLLLEAGVDPEAVDSKGRKYTDLSENNI